MTFATVSPQFRRRLDAKKPELRLFSCAFYAGFDEENA